MNDRINVISNKKITEKKCGDCFYCYKLFGFIWCMKPRPEIKKVNPDKDACDNFIG